MRSAEHDPNKFVVSIFKKFQNFISMNLISLGEYYKPHATQLAFHKSNARYKLIGGAMGGGKSKALCAEAILLSHDIPGNRGAIIRKNMTTLRRTTMVTFFETIPQDMIAEYNRSEMRVVTREGSEILFLEADESKDPLFEKLKSLELGWFAIDEASEVPRAAFQILASRLRWKAAKGRYVGLLASNPEQCWVKEDFIDRKKTGHKYFPSLPRDNPNLPDDYLPRLREIFDEHQQRKYIDGDWNVTDDPLQVIPYSMLRNCVATKDELAAVEGEWALGVDVAELGDDKSVLCFFRGAACTEIEHYSRLRIDQLTAIVKQRIVEKDIASENIGVDAVGNGAGLWGNLVGAGFDARRIIAGAAEVPDVFPHSFANLKSQLWWAVRTAVMDPDSGFRIPDRAALIQDLTAVRYSIEQERTIAVESKDQLRRRLGRSPDEGDACVIANWVRQHLGERRYRFEYIR